MNNCATFFTKATQTYPRSNDHKMVDAEVRVLGDASWKKVKELFKRRLGGVVFRRVHSITTKARAVHTVHSPTGKTVISDAKASEMEWETFFRTTFTEIKGPYSFVTAKGSSYPARDVYQGEEIWASSKDRCEVDPVTLRFVKAKGHSPRISQRMAPEADDPMSLVVGLVARQGGRLVYTHWAIASFQMIWAVLLGLYPDEEVPFRQDEYKSPETSRIYWTSGNRGCSNEFRRILYSEKHSGTPLSEEDAHKHFKISVTGADTYCHVWAMWILMVRYGEMPSQGNIPSVVPPPMPKDPEARKRFYAPKPMKFWDLPFMSFQGKSVKLDRYLAAQLGLNWTIQTKRIPFHIKVLRPQDFEEPAPGEVVEFADAPILVPSRPSSPILTQDLNGLSQDSEEMPPVEEPQVTFTWADCSLEDSMEFEKPIESGGLWKNLSAAFFASFSG